MKNKSQHKVNILDQRKGQNDSKFDLSKRQRNAFEASVENAKIANDAIKSSQGWLLVLGLAEMSFLGTLLIKDDSVFATPCLKILIIFLLIAFIFFILGSVFQYRHALNSARKYEEISNRVLDSYLNKNIHIVDKIPKELELPKKQMVTSKTANYLIFGSYILVILATIGVIFMVTKL